MKKIVFITGTRADYGKIKSLILALEKSDQFEPHIFVSGMHLLEKYGSTYLEVLKDGFQNVYVDFSQQSCGTMSYDLGNVICNLTAYISHIRPDMIVVHGDRIDALAGAIVGALNNIRVAHIEGGELSGTIDESMRHAITKFAHLHFVCNEDARARLIQLGEEKERIYVVGSPDIDIMLSKNLPSYAAAREKYEIGFEHYAILMYHPVTTEIDSLREKVKELVDAVMESGRNYIVIYPNNDAGTDIIFSEYKRFRGDPHFLIYPSLRFEHFLTLLKHADFMIGNSSAGVRETSVYGIPAIDIGSRQMGRISPDARNIQHVEEDKESILHAIGQAQKFQTVSRNYGNGDSTEKFIEILKKEESWNFKIQKSFVDIHLDF